MITISESQSRNRRRRTFLGSMIVMLAVILGISGAGQSQIGSTQASWASEASAQGILEAGTVQAAVLADEACKYVPGVLGIGAKVEVYWSAPDNYGLDNTQILTYGSGLGAGLVPVTGYDLVENTAESTDANYDYVTTFSKNLLGGVIGLDTLNIAIQMVDPLAPDWTSAPVFVEARSTLLGGGRCNRADGP